MQVVELEVALANGTLATFTEASYPHLFKALQVRSFCSPGHVDNKELKGYKNST